MIITGNSLKGTNENSVFSRLGNNQMTDITQATERGLASNPQKNNNMERNGLLQKYLIFFYEFMIISIIFI